MKLNLFGSRKEKQPPSIEVSTSVRVLAILYLICQLFVLVRGFVIQDIPQHLIIPLAIVSVLLGCGTIWLVIATIGSYRAGKKQEEKLLEEGHKLLEESEDSPKNNGES